MAGENSIPERSALELFVKIREGWLASRALHVAAELGVADGLKVGAKNSEQVAEATGANPPSTYQILRTLAGHEVFEEDSGGRLHLTAIGASCAAISLKLSALGMTFQSTTLGQFCTGDNIVETQ